MSDQPTHAETKLALLSAWVEYRDRVGELERENAQLRAAIAESEQFAVKHAPAVLELKADKAILDFLECPEKTFWVEVRRWPDGEEIFNDYGAGLRSAVKKAMESPAP